MNWRTIGPVPLATWRAVLASVGAPDELRSEAAWQAAGEHSALCLAQLLVESGGGTSNLARSHRNPLGLRPRDGGEGFVVFASFVEAIRFWYGKITDPAYAYADTVTLEQYVHVYAPASDNNDEATYVRDIETYVRSWPRDQEDTPPMPEPKIPTIVIDAGHRSTDRSGNPAEMSMTDDLAVAYVDELRRRGYEAYWYERDLDRDSDPDETIGNLNTVAKGLGAWLRSQPWALMLSLHYNGSHSALHAIVPDNVGLSTAYPEGRDPADTAANNPLDRQVGVAIVREMHLDGLGLTFMGKLGEPGLMSETETGVGRGSPGEYPPSRLAVFAATAPSRQTAVRLVIEHGGTSDPAAQRFADFARAAADAIEAVYGKATTPSTTTTAPPAPSPYADPDTAWMDGDKPGKRTDHALMMTLGGTKTEVRAYALERQYEAIRATPRYQKPDTKGPRVGPNLKVRETFVGSYFAVVGSQRWVCTPAGSWILASALTPRVSVKAA